LDELLPKDAAQTLCAFRRDVLAALPGLVESVLLFGSRARGGAAEDSDYDVAVILRSGADDVEGLQRRVADVAWAYQQDGLELQVLTLRAEDLRPARTELAIRVAVDGVSLGADHSEWELTEGPSSESEWREALAFLAEAETRSAGVTPRMSTHAAYYAMYHGARAVLLEREGMAAPLKHNVVANRFGYQARLGESPTLVAASQALREVKRLREKFDYELDVAKDPVAAESAVRLAREFLEACAAAHGSPKPSAPVERN
jgi:predicted nucleotidyltransferase/uncharacterized protein (UPF0332 family)